jgi:hypothetical protein
LLRPCDEHASNPGRRDSPERKANGAAEAFRSAGTGPYALNRHGRVARRRAANRALSRSGPAATGMTALLNCDSRWVSVLACCSPGGGRSGRASAEVVDGTQFQPRQVGLAKAGLTWKIAGVPGLGGSAPRETCSLPAGRWVMARRGAALRSPDRQPREVQRAAVLGSDHPSHAARHCG